MKKILEKIGNTMRDHWVISYFAVGIIGATAMCLMAAYVPTMVKSTPPPIVAARSTPPDTETLFICGKENNVLIDAHGKGYVISSSGVTMDGREVPSREAYESIKPHDTFRARVARHPTQKDRNGKILALKTAPAPIGPPAC